MVCIQHVDPGKLKIKNPWKQVSCIFLQGTDHFSSKNQWINKSLVFFNPIIKYSIRPEIAGVNIYKPSPKRASGLLALPIEGRGAPNKLRPNYRTRHFHVGRGEGRPEM